MVDNDIEIDTEVLRYLNYMLREDYQSDSLPESEIVVNEPEIVVNEPDITDVEVYRCLYNMQIDYDDEDEAAETAGTASFSSQSDSYNSDDENSILYNAIKSNYNNNVDDQSDFAPIDNLIETEAMDIDSMVDHSFYETMDIDLVEDTAQLLDVPVDPSLDDNQDEDIDSNCTQNEAVSSNKSLSSNENKMIMSSTTTENLDDSLELPEFIEKVKKTPIDWEDEELKLDNGMSTFFPTLCANDLKKNTQNAVVRMWWYDACESYDDGLVTLFGKVN